MLVDNREAVEATRWDVSIFTKVVEGEEEEVWGVIMACTYPLFPKASGMRMATKLPLPHLSLAHLSCAALITPRTMSTITAVDRMREQKRQEKAIRVDDEASVKE